MKLIALLIAVISWAGGALGGTLSGCSPNLCYDLEKCMEAVAIHKGTVRAFPKSNVLNCYDKVLTQNGCTPEEAQYVVNSVAKNMNMSMLPYETGQKPVGQRQRGQNKAGKIGNHFIRQSYKRRNGYDEDYNLIGNPDYDYGNRAADDVRNDDGEELFFLQNLIEYVWDWRRHCQSCNGGYQPEPPTEQPLNNVTTLHPLSDEPEYESPLPSDESPVSSDEPSVPSDEPSVPSDEPSVPSDEPSVPSDELPLPSDEPEYEPPVPSDEPLFPSDEPLYPSDEPLLPSEPEYQLPYDPPPPPYEPPPPPYEPPPPPYEPPPPPYEPPPPPYEPLPPHPLGRLLLKGLHRSPLKPDASKLMQDILVKSYHDKEVDLCIEFLKSELVDACIPNLMEAITDPKFQGNLFIGQSMDEECLYKAFGHCSFNARHTIQTSILHKTELHVPLTYQLSYDVDICRPNYTKAVIYDVYMCMRMHYNSLVIKNLDVLVHAIANCMNFHIFETCISDNTTRFRDFNNALTKFMITYYEVYHSQQTSRVETGCMTELAYSNYEDCILEYRTAMMEESRKVPETRYRGMAVACLRGHFYYCSPRIQQLLLYMMTKTIKDDNHLSEDTTSSYDFYEVTVFRCIDRSFEYTTKGDLVSSYMQAHKCVKDVLCRVKSALTKASDFFTIYDHIIRYIDNKIDVGNSNQTGCSDMEYIYKCAVHIFNLNAYIETKYMAFYDNILPFTHKIQMCFRPMVLKCPINIVSLIIEIGSNILCMNNMWVPE